MALDDKAHVGHRHTTSDVRGGRFPEGMLPSTIVPSIEAAQATAASKSKVIFSANAASGTDFSEGDTWYQRVAGIIIGQWEFTAGAWASRTLDGAVVANLDASKIRTGTLAAGQKITAGDPEGSRVELDSAGLRKYATDGTTVQVDLTGDVAAFSGLITGSEIIAGTAGAARVELDSAGLRVYAADGTTVLLDTADDATIRVRGDSTALGADAQSALMTGDFNTAVGSFVQKALTTGNSDTAVGAFAQKALTTGYRNTAIGTAAQRDLTTGIDNTAVGSDAQKALTTGTGNTAVGLDAQRALTSGHYNTAVGPGAQQELTTGLLNTAIGIEAQRELTTGTSNTAVGPSAQYAPRGVGANATTAAYYQTSIGGQSGQSSPTQVDGITTIGYRATAGAANATSIGREARADHAGSIALGYQSLTTQTNQVMVGPRDVEITDTTKGLVLVSPDGTRMRITTADDGSLLVNGTAIGGGSGGPLFADPNTDQLVFWDDSAGAFAPLNPANGLILTGTDLMVRLASDAQTGIVELATSAEAVTGTDTVRAVTPAGVKEIGKVWSRLDTTNAQGSVRRQWGIARLTAPGGTIKVTPLTITFPVAFSGIPHVTASTMGYRAAGAYDPTGLTAGSSDAWLATATERSTTAMTLHDVDLTGNLMSAGYDIYVSWEAVGPA